MLYEYLLENYEPNEPIFVSDVDLPVTDNNLRQMFKTLCDDGRINRFEPGIYYLPKESRLKGGSALTADAVAIAKYISRNGKTVGYYSGNTFANILGITTQVPYVVEIVTNNTSTRVREVKVRNKRIMLRRARTTIDNENYVVLQFLDLLKDIDQYYDLPVKDVSARLISYIRAENIRREDIDKYIKDYPDKIYRNLYELRLYDAFA